MRVRELRPRGVELKRVKCEVDDFARIGRDVERRSFFRAGKKGAEDQIRPADETTVRGREREMGEVVQ